MPSLSIAPHSAVGGETPSPRNDSAASASSSRAVCRVASTTTGEAMFGTTWRTAIRSGLTPSARAASMNGCSLTASTSPRTSRAYVDPPDRHQREREVREPRAERAGDGEREQEARKREQDVDDAHEQAVDEAAGHARDRPDDEAR